MKLRVKCLKWNEFESEIELKLREKTCLQCSEALREEIFLEALRYHPDVQRRYLQERKEEVILDRGNM